jgi:hypothetical protein
LPGDGVNQALPVILEAQECKKMQNEPRGERKWDLLVEKIEFLTEALLFVN